MINVTSDELIERLKKDKNSYLLDVRTADEFEDSHIPDSKLLNIRDPQLFMDGITLYKGLKTTTKTMTINSIVGISLIILKNFEVFLFSFDANNLRFFPKKKW